MKIKAGLRLEELMEDYGINLTELSKASGIHVSNLRKYINGSQKQYSAYALYALAIVFECQVGDLFQRIEEDEYGREKDILFVTGKQKCRKTIEEY